MFDCIYKDGIPSNSMTFLTMLGMPWVSLQPMPSPLHATRWSWRQCDAMSFPSRLLRMTCALAQSAEQGEEFSH